MGSRGRLVLFMLLGTAAAAACGITAVGQSGPAEGGLDPDAREATGGSSGLSSTSSGGDPDGGPAGDGALDGTLEDADSACPAQCNGGCDGGCNITGEGGAVACPPGAARCSVTCPVDDDCASVSCGDAAVCTISCPSGNACKGTTMNCGTSACTVRCTGNDACENTISAGSAASLCIYCDGNPGCNSMTCTIPAICTRQYVKQGGNSMGDCESCVPGVCP